MSSINISAPAKINLFLEVAEKRSDDYHSLRTVFQAIDLVDTIELKESESGISLINDWPELPNGQNNLCWKAAALLARATGCGRGVQITLHKEIPVGAGLGGGSSDAAATLLGLNKLWELNLSPRELLPIGERLGADVNFFLQGGSRLGEGKGEILSPLAPVRLHFVTAWPRVLLPTAAVYAAWDERPERGAVGLEAFLEAWRKGEPEIIAAHFRNDLQAAAERLCPVCGELIEELMAAGCLGELVSGSGSAVFGLAATRLQAEAIAQALRARRPHCWIRSAETLAAGDEGLA
jgi:4-diphosphocytidyl-2-C-methyl-D-erythritol kinase